MVLTIVSERGGGGGALNEDSGVSIGGLDGSGGEVGGAERRKEYHSIFMTSSTWILGRFQC